jgi:hypothetical protein
MEMAAKLPELPPRRPTPEQRAHAAELARIDAEGRAARQRLLEEHAMRMRYDLPDPAAREAELARAHKSDMERWAAYAPGQGEGGR